MDNAGSLNKVFIVSISCMGLLRVRERASTTADIADVSRLLKHTTLII